MYLIAWVLAAIVLGWRLGKAWQVARADTRQRARAAMIAPYGTVGTPTGRAGHPADQARTVRQTEGVRGQAATAGPRDRAPAGQEPPVITVEQAMAELDQMIGLAPVKDQIRQLTASVEAAHRRLAAGYQTEKPLQHFVFLGPPGTGKTSVARIIAKLYYACGLLDSPAVVEAQRADLVGEYLGATAIKTNDLIDSAVGGVLFIDEAYSLANDGEGHADRFGNEAVQALLKRAEDDRDNLVVILAGYQRQMEDFLASNPGLNSRFPMRVRFGGYSPAELVELAQTALAQRGESLDSEALRGLTRMMEDVGRRRLIDELGNGRFVRNLLEKARQARDVRVMSRGPEPVASELMTLRAEDLERAFGELTSRFRGYAEAPTLENALAELDELVGLEPVKRQVHEIVAQLRVARLRDRQGLASQPPARHFVFTGPPGTGKTTVARILGRIFAALGLLVRPEVVEAHRADLVGEHLGSTAIKTGQADRLRARRRAVHRRGVLAVQRGLLRRRRLRVRGGGHAAQAGRGRPGPAGDRAGRVPGGHGPVPAQQSGAGLAVLGPHLVPQLHPGASWPRSWASSRNRRATRSTRTRCPSSSAIFRDAVRPGPHRRAGQRPVRAVPVRARLRRPRPAGRRSRRGRHRRRPDHGHRGGHQRRGRRAHR